MNFNFQAKKYGHDMNITLINVQYSDIEGLIWDGADVEIETAQGEYFDLDDQELFNAFEICITTDLQEDYEKAGIWDLFK